MQCHFTFTKFRRFTREEMLRPKCSNCMLFSVSFQLAEITATPISRNHWITENHLAVHFFMQELSHFSLAQWRRSLVRPPVCWSAYGIFPRWHWERGGTHSGQGPSSFCSHYFTSAACLWWWEEAREPVRNQHNATHAAPHRTRETTGLTHSWHLGTTQDTSHV